MKKWIILLILSCLFICTIFGQSNEVIDEILNQPKISYGNAVYMVLAMGDLIPEEKSVQAAIEELAGLNWKIPVKVPEDDITTEEFAVLVMKGLDLKGGLMFSLFPNKRYAYREMVFQKYLDPEGGRKRPVLGDEALRILGMINREGSDQ